MILKVYVSEPAVSEYVPFGATASEYPDSSGVCHFPLKVMVYVTVLKGCQTVMTTSEVLISALCSR